jgi:hypothetical protein
MATKSARKFSKTAKLDASACSIVFEPVFRPQPETGYWLELALAHSDVALAAKAGILGPLSGAQSGSEAVTEWREFQAQVLGILKGLLTSRPDVLNTTEESLREQIGAVEQDHVPQWNSLPAAATALIQERRIMLTSIDPTVFGAMTNTGNVLANALNEAKRAQGIAACVYCETAFTYGARERQYCTPACRKAACVEEK